MRQQSQSQHQSNSAYITESHETRKQRLDKKRAIRKNKIGILTQDPTQLNEDKKNLTKQQKLQLQKAKNREAAQRSRDQHKKYVETLEEENKRLKEQLCRPRICSKCLKEIQVQSGDSTDPSVVEYQPERHLSTFIQNQNNQELQQFQSPFIRMNDYQESSPLKMFLFISMIILGVFIISGNHQAAPSEGLIIKRDLMEVPIQNNRQVQQNISFELQTKKSQQIQQIDKFQLRNQIQNSFNMLDTSAAKKVMTEVVPLTYQLSPLSQQSCLRSIIDNNFTKVGEIAYPNLSKPSHKKPTSLRLNEVHQMQIFSHSLQEPKSNILFCSLPKLYRKSEQTGSNIFSKFIDIIISGSEMMEIIGKSPNLWMNKIINFNGIYKINAEVKEIVQIQDKNCIL